MAGSYPDVPSRRMAYDADGTVVLEIADGQPAVELDAVTKVELNDEDTSDLSFLGVNVLGYLIFIFPELRDVDGIFMGTGESSEWTTVETSPDTTNGIDGTWTTQIADLDTDSDTYPTEYRDNITSMAVNAVRGVRIRKSGTGGSSDQRVQAVHLYGTISSGETPDRLLWIDDDTGLEFTEPIDFGDIPRGSARDVSLKLKNNSSSLTATTIQYTAEDLYLGSGAWYTFTLPGGVTFSSQQQIASLGPGATTSTITLRQVVPDDETVGLHAARIFTDVTSWS